MVYVRELWEAHQCCKCKEMLNELGEVMVTNV